MDFKCTKCNSNLKEVGVYSSKPTMFVFNDDTNEFEAFIESDDFKVHCCNCGAVVDDSKMSFKF